MAVITPEQVAAFRLDSHHLLDPLSPDHLADVARDTGGIQAQVSSAARLSFRARTHGITSEMVDDALWKDRSLVKIWIMRHTVHILPAEDLPIYISALGGSLMRITQNWYEQAGLTAEVRRTMLDAALEALEGGPMTRKDLADSVEPIIGSKHRRWVEGSWGGVMKQGFLEGDMVFGPDRGQNSTFMRRDQALPAWDPPPVEEALTHLMRTYLHAYGPARVQDFVAWTASTVKECKGPWATLADETVEVQHGGRACSMLKEDHERAVSIEPEGLHVDLLGHFDTYLLGHKERTEVVDRPFLKRVSRPAGWIMPVVRVNGRAVATWSVERKASKATISVAPFGKLPTGVRPAIRQEAKDLARYWDLPVKVEYVN